MTRAGHILIIAAAAMLAAGGATSSWAIGARPRAQTAETQTASKKPADTTAVHKRSASEPDQAAKKTLLDRLRVKVRELRKDEQGKRDDFIDLDGDGIDDRLEARQRDTVHRVPTAAPLPDSVSAPSPKRKKP